MSEQPKRRCARCNGLHHIEVSAAGGMKIVPCPSCRMPPSVVEVEAKACLVCNGMGVLIMVGGEKCTCPTCGGSGGVEPKSHPPHPDQKTLRDEIAIAVLPIVVARMDQSNIKGAEFDPPTLIASLTWEIVDAVMKKRIE